MKDKMIEFLKSELLKQESIYKQIEIERVALNDKVKYLDQQKKFLNERMTQLKTALAYFGILK